MSRAGARALALGSALAAGISGAAAASGEELYAEHCASCHGARLEGQADWRKPGADGRYPAPPHDATGHTWHHGDGMLADYVRRGGQAVLDEIGVQYRSAMPSFGEMLSDAEIVAVLDFIKSAWPEELRAYQAQATLAERGE